MSLDPLPAAHLAGRMAHVVDLALGGRRVAKPPVLGLKPFVPPVRQHLPGLHAALVRTTAASRQHVCEAQGLGVWGQHLPGLRAALVRTTAASRQHVCEAQGLGVWGQHQPGLHAALVRSELHNSSELSARMQNAGFHSYAKARGPETTHDQSAGNLLNSTQHAPAKDTHTQQILMFGLARMNSAFTIACTHRGELHGDTQAKLGHGTQGRAR